MKSGWGTQAALLSSFEPAVAGNPIFCHQEFLEKMELNRANTVGKRAALLLHRLLVDERRQYYKSTYGLNRGWRRSRLGGNGGSHFYAWWAPKGAPPLKGLAGFEGAPAGSIFVRDIRHHDDHSLLNPQELDDAYLPVGVAELRREDYVPAPWTTSQSKFATARQHVRVIKGHPGSGKTTALWHAADLAAAGSVLYVTYSPELAAMARDHFARFAPAAKRFHVVTFPQLLRELAGGGPPPEPVTLSRARFVRETGGFSPRTLGPWNSNRAALYDEMHAHLVGSALPLAIGRFPASQAGRVGIRPYRELRERHIGRPAAEAALEVADVLSKRDSRSLEERFFPELWLARSVVLKLLEPRPAAPGALLDFDCLALDEAQDLTPVEALALLELAAAIQKRGGRPLTALVAGDEAQTVRPTDFEWGWFHDLAHARLGSPAEFKLPTNLRSPRRIGELVNRIWDLYSHLNKQDRPGGLGRSEIDEDSSDQVVFCAATPGAELDELLAALAEREGLALISLDEEPPAYLPAAVRERVLSVFEAKGLDFHSVCVLDAGRHLSRAVSGRAPGRDFEIEELSRRLAIDRLRVALSRPAERLYWLDVSPNERALTHSRHFLAVDGTGGEVFPVIPAVVLKTLDEELLGIEERVRLCEQDARQYLEVKPAMAWSRARQAVGLLEGNAARQAGVDETVRRSAHLTLAQIAFCLAFRRVELSSELGRPDLFGEAASHAGMAGRAGLARVIRCIGDLERCYSQDRLGPTLLTGRAIAAHRADLEGWLLVEISAKAAGWIETLENAVAATPLAAQAMVELLPLLFDLFQTPDAPRRTARIRQRAVRSLIESGAYREALAILAGMPEPAPELEAVCYEGAGDFHAAAERYLKAGKPQEALRAYRNAPDFEKALELIGALREHPAAESLQWLQRMRELIAQRPAEFPKVILPSEKKLLEQMLQDALGATRKKAAPRKTAGARKPGRPRKVRQG
jgi:hypothetical protein